MLIFCIFPIAKNSSASMQSLMELVMRGHPVEFLLVYLDDVLIATLIEEMYLEMFGKVFEALFCAGLKVNLAKCVFSNTLIHALGFTLDTDRILSKIHDWPKPKDITGIRSFSISIITTFVTLPDLPNLPSRLFTS